MARNASAVNFWSPRGDSQIDQSDLPSVIHWQWVLTMSVCQFSSEQRQTRRCNQMNEGGRFRISLVAGKIVSHFDACNFMLFNFAARAPCVWKLIVIPWSKSPGDPFLRGRKTSLICGEVSLCHCSGDRKCAGLLFYGQPAFWLFCLPRVRPRDLLDIQGGNNIGTLILTVSITCLNFTLTLLKEIILHLNVVTLFHGLFMS